MISDSQWPTDLSNHPVGDACGASALVAESVNRQTHWLDRFAPSVSHVGYGQLGLHGELGYENQFVRICGVDMPHAISAHAPSHLVYHLDGNYHDFYSHVGFNDTAPQDVTSADFLVVADGEVVGVAQNVRPGQTSRCVSADIQGARKLELLVQTRRWSSCHAVWADPVVVSGTSTAERREIDALERAEIVVPAGIPRCSLCIATVGSPGFEGWIDDLFGSVCANAQCPEAHFVIFSIGDAPEIRRVAEKYGGTVLPCRPLRTLNAASKAILYAAGNVIPAKNFICLDADMLVLDDLRPIIATIEATPPGSILACREANWAENLEDGISAIYGGLANDIDQLIGGESLRERRYPFVVNDGLFAGSRASLRALDCQMRRLSQPSLWVDDPIANKPWRNQFVFNLALAQTESGIELDSRYNVQLHCQRAEVQVGLSRIVANTHGRKASVLHFNGWGRHHHWESRGHYRTVGSPITRPKQGGHAYEAFCSALRTWIGRYGINALAWSFYGTADSFSATIADASTFPLFATLHYLIRSNGCRRVIETGTARGVSTACLASAVAHRDDPTVITFDVQRMPEREALWQLLPDDARACITARDGDSLVGMREAIAAGESFHAALLDSLHTAEHVLSEFELARQLVCPGGIILVHDAILRAGTVDQALDEIQRQGFGVTRLWTADDGDREDDRLGLAVIENRRRSGS